MELKDITGTRKLWAAPITDVRHPFDSDASGVCFSLDDDVFFVFEDPSDGYRSNAAPVLHAKGQLHEFGNPNIDYVREDVVCSHLTSSKDEWGEEQCDLLILTSVVTGKEIFRVGTTNTDDYYPSFVCQWQPGNLSANQ